jgi:hypothetical protein
MTAEEFRNAKDLWRMEYAHATFKSVEAGIKSLLERGLNQTSPEYYPLSVGIICLYCRPFTDNALVGQISVKVVPDEYRDSHDRVLQFRNQIFAHSAGDAILGDDQYMNSVKLRKFHGRFSLYITQSTPMPEFFDRLMPLVGILVKETDRRRLERLEEFRLHVPDERDGYFRLNIFDQNGPVFIKIEDNWPESVDKAGTIQSQAPLEQ